MGASLLGGAIGSALTNCFEVLTINKQASSEYNLWQVIKNENVSLLSKGIAARVTYNSMHSIMFFHLIFVMGKIYNVELSEE